MVAAAERTFFGKRVLLQEARTSEPEDNNEYVHCQEEGCIGLMIPDDQEIC